MLPVNMLLIVLEVAFAWLESLASNKIFLDDDLATTGSESRDLVNVLELHFQQGLRSMCTPAIGSCAPTAVSEVHHMGFATRICALTSYKKSCTTIEI